MATHSLLLQWPSRTTERYGLSFSYLLFLHLIPTRSLNVKMWTLTITSQVCLLDGHSVPPLCTNVAHAVVLLMRGRTSAQSFLGPVFLIVLSLLSLRLLLAPVLSRVAIFLGRPGRRFTGL